MPFHLINSVLCQGIHIAKSNVKLVRGYRIENNNYIVTGAYVWYITDWSWLWLTVRMCVTAMFTCYMKNFKLNIKLKIGLKSNCSWPTKVEPSCLRLSTEMKNSLRWQWFKKADSLDWNFKTISKGKRFELKIVGSSRHLSLFNSEVQMQFLRLAKFRFGL